MARLIIFFEEYVDLDILKSYPDYDIEIYSFDPKRQSFLTDKVRFFNSKDLINKEFHIFLSKKVNEIVKVLRSNPNFTFSKETDHSSAVNFIHFSRHFFYYCFSMIYLINKILTNLKSDDRVILFQDDKDIKSYAFNQIGALNEGFSMLNYLLGLYLKANNQVNVIHHRVKFNSMPRARKKSKLEIFFRAIFFKLQLIFFRFFTSEKKKIFAYSSFYNINRILGIVDPKEKYLKVFLSSKFSFKEVYKSFLGKEFFFFAIPETVNTKLRYEPDIQIEEYSKLIATLAKDGVFKIYRTDLGNLYQSYLNNWLFYYLKSIYIKSLHIGKIFQGENFDFFVAQTAVGLAYAISDRTIESNVKSFLVPHGSFPNHSNKISLTEWSEHGRTLINTNYQYVSIQTPWAEKFLEQQDQTVSIPLKTGPLIFADRTNSELTKSQLREKIFKKHHRNKRIYLHASTPKLFSNFIPYVYETFDEYVKNLNDIIEVIHSQEGVHLAIRFRQKGISVDEFRKLLIKSDCYELYSDCSFDEILFASDLLISYSSTSIEESLINRTPVLQYDPDNKYCHITGDNSTEIIQYDALYYANSNEKLLKILQWLNNCEFSRFDSDAIWKSTVLDIDRNWIKSLVS